jgi:coproporphyrinogen III oxidase
MLRVEAMRVRMEQMVLRIQDTISTAVEQVDGQRFREDRWTREEGGGGISRVLQHGTVFEKAGVNVSTVTGTLSSEARRSLKLGSENLPAGPVSFFATGVSVVLHPHHPLVPTVHANYRYFELNDGKEAGSWWFGGGSDLTPSYLFEEDAVHFHRQLKNACDRHDPAFYPRFKKSCDEYFFIPHRGECRGIGGIFFDHLHDREQDFYFSFVTACAEAFVPSYIPIVEKRRHLPFTARQKSWQQLRRGRYVEFNLIYDRGTTFGLKTGGRTESILMSLPHTAAWEYDYQPDAGSPEAVMLDVLKNPREWLS